MPEGSQSGHEVQFTGTMHSLGRVCRPENAFSRYTTTWPILMVRFQAVVGPRVCKNIEPLPDSQPILRDRERINASITRCGHDLLDVLLHFV